jgi:2-methylcitrate dehydratase PrpD
VANRVVSGSDRASLGDGFTARVAQDVMSLSSRSWSDQVLERVRHAVTDWMGVTIFGARNESARIAQQFALFEGGNPVSRIIGTPYKVTARQAALASGIATHANDYDDTAFACHPSAMVLPAAFAVAEAVGADGSATVDAMVQGYEAIKLIMAAVGTDHAGAFHAVGTFGVFGATAAAARLLGLDLLQLERAFGIAATQAAGLKASHGTMSKHLHAGHACGVGVLSAYLAQCGYTGATNVIEAPQGFACGYTNEVSEFDPRAKDSFVGERLGVQEIVFKRYAACGGSHSAIAGAQALKAEHFFSADDVESVDVLQAASLDQVCNISEPTSAAEGMFSTCHTVAMALLGAGFTPDSFTDATVNDARTVTMRERVRVTSQEETPVDSSQVRIKLRNGRVLQATVNALVAVPDEELPRQRVRLEEKYRDLVEPLLGGDRTDELLNAVRRIEILPSIADLTDLTDPRT